MKRRSFAIILSSLVAAYAATAFLAETTGCVDGVTPDCSGDSGCGPDEVTPADDGATPDASPDASPDSGGASDGGGSVDGASDAARRDGAADAGDAAKPTDARAG
jgi:hypothetical protein